jgi:tryptophanyl-tRNA synthetase
MRPTGRLHLGNLLGALQNWVDLQNSGLYDCFYFIADWHALTSDYDQTESLKNYRTEIIIDWLASGLDPEKSTLFIQSAIKEHAELYLLLSMITPLPWLERNPTYKEMKAELADRDLSTLGFLGYPVLQAADIIMYKAHGVPVGADQLPHIELTREIVRRFHYLYRDVFPIPEPLLADFPKILGIDGRKMSKSYDNAIYLNDRGDALREKVSRMFTDPQRIRRSDPGRPELCNVFAFHGIYTDPERQKQIEYDCIHARMGCTDCKKNLADNLLKATEPIHERQDYYGSHPDTVGEIIASGNERAQTIAQSTMEEIREAIRI